MLRFESLFNFISLFFLSAGLPTIALNTDTPLKSGSPTSFTCQFELPVIESIFVYFEWAKSDTSPYSMGDAQPIALSSFTFVTGMSPPSVLYTAIARRGPSPEHIITVDMIAGTSYLNITSVNTQDSGFYWCTYSSGSDPKARASVSMTVLGEYSMHLWCSP